MTDSGDVLIGAVDQGTSSTRFLVFNSQTSELLTYHQVELEHKLPKEGWVQMDPDAILESVYQCIDKAVENLQGMKIDPRKIKSIGITNQRETTVAWDKRTGKALHDAIVWLDIRTAETVEKLVSKTPNNDKDFLRPRCGLPITTYFSAVKMRWLVDNIDSVSSALKSDSCLFGTVDSWLVWNMTGGLNGGKFITDVTNASRTMLMNLKTLGWDQELCSFFELPMSALPDIKSSAEVYGHVTEGSLKGVPIAGILGDQQAALVGQTCFQIGQAKNTYGTGCFMLYNTGSEAIDSTRGLLTTVAYKLGPEDPVCYALEGSVAIAGACVRWLRDNLGIIKTSEEIESLASEVDSTHDCYFVPAFSGLFCPYWHSDARGIICGLTQFTNKSHIARAALEAVAFQSRELLDAMNADSGIPITSLKVDGGMTNNNLMMQIQADMLGISIVKPAMSETTALGAAMAAGKTIGAWNMGASGSAVATTTFTPGIESEERELRYARWKKAVAKSMNWA